MTTEEKNLNKYCSRILELVREFNTLIKNSIDGPNCIDPNICDGNCCFIHIDIPKELVDYYREKGYASQNHFQRGATFTYEIKVDLDTLRCVFYNRKINGCSLHQTGMKPPQCWVYPTGLDPETEKTTCKKSSGWKITDENAVKRCKEILEEYVHLSKQEAVSLNSPDFLVSKILDSLIQDAGILKPSEIAGIVLEEEIFKVLRGEGFNLGLKSLCDKQQCEFNYFECQKVCPSIEQLLLIGLRKALINYLVSNPFKREYTLLELKKFF